MNIMLADIEQSALAAAIARLRKLDIAAEGVITDVSKRASVKAAADATLRKFGKVHIVCNNAGVALSGELGKLREQDWDWIIDVNLKGVVHGTELFASLIEAHGEGGHFVNTASMAAMFSMPQHQPYSATKFAVVAMCEGWAEQLAPKRIGMSVLCPAFVRTRIHDSKRNQPGAHDGEQLQQQDPVHLAAAAAVAAGIDPEPVAERVIEAIRDNELYVFTHVEFQPVVEARFQRIRDAFARSRLSPALCGLPARTLKA